ncbi:hypothetical protein [uncultured Tyzzerella sp.]|uniref:hypothetical protein n=1 Tax=uncultured Tyzzerella sp. TaxID=2321398 RepID=UPI002943714B|nr:hypothetical protein [uncultured Tyzzerella sp.]
MQYSIKDFLDSYSVNEIKGEEKKEDNVEIGLDNNMTNSEENTDTEQTKLDNNVDETGTNMEQPKMSEDEKIGYIREREMELMRKSYSEINTFLYPFVTEVLDEFEFIGSPIYSISGIDRETIYQMVDRVINLAEEILDQVGEAKNERTGNYLREWDRWGLLRACIESLLLNDIFAIRRPNYYRNYAPTILR